MIIPIRCFTCGKHIGHLWDRYNLEIQSEFKKDYDGTPIHVLETSLKDKNESVEKKSLDKLGLRRYCCRRMMMGHIQIVQKV